MLPTGSPARPRMLRHENYLRHPRRVSEEIPYPKIKKPILRQPLPPAGSWRLCPSAAAPFGSAAAAASAAFFFWRSPSHAPPSPGLAARGAFAALGSASFLTLRSDLAQLLLHPFVELGLGIRLRRKSALGYTAQQVLLVSTPLYERIARQVSVGCAPSSTNPEAVRN